MHESRGLGDVYKRQVPDREAYDLFLRGRYLWYRRREGDMMQAMELYQQAIGRDPTFPDPYVGLADALNVLGAYLYMDPREAYARALQLVEKALTIDPDLASAHAARGFINGLHRFDCAQSEHDFRRSIELEPRAAAVRCWYAGMLNAMGSHAEGAEQARRAIELEPMSPLILGLAGWNIAFENIEEGLRHQKRAVDIDPNHPVATQFLATLLVERLQAYEEALPHVEKALAGGVKLAFALAVLAFSKTGRTDRLAEVENAVEGMQPRELTPNWNDALRAFGDSDRDGYLDAIGRAVEIGEYATTNLAVWTFSDFVRDDPRFHALLERIGLEDVPRCPLRGAPP